ncbi:hypothetical protein [Hyalangium rubrum]|uniref:Lipoprotein n=1 Tax=Hyalangium rubrum TaxID=3103134 RepID=A0ABU5H110_9BACT|nr:hypothetical protein [Hyalangium sp. s54d21]MDY7227136.1 hypothetical protein [Hyalangium sp. s54d21]
MKSDEVQGLKPGFHVLLLGLCEPASAEAVLPLLQALYPGTYVRPVRVPAEQLDCPRPEHEAKLVSKEALTQGNRGLTVTLVRTENGSPATTPAVPRMYVRTVLRDSNGKQVDAQLQDFEARSGEMSGCEVSLQRKGAALVLRTECSSPTVNYPFCTPIVETSTTTFKPGPEKLQSSTKESSSGGECNWSNAD